MSEPQFALASTPGLYWLAEPALPAGYGIALVLAADAPPAPATLTLAASWTAHPGLYAMCAARPDAAAESEFLHALRNAWSWLGASARFLWLAQTDLANTAGWSPQTLHVAQAAGSPTATLAAPANLRFGRYSVNLARGLTLTQREDGFALSGGPPAPLSLSTPEAQWLLGAPGGQQPATALSFAGATAGCLALSLALPQ
ncbi:MAG TPA: hypothetical protein VMS02_02110, partial [Solirubrobacteraceae bacterium]|nr:hypothetical protein [Solirubrobacteraceae bacterium]